MTSDSDHPRRKPDREAARAAAGGVFEGPTMIEMLAT